MFFGVVEAGSKKVVSVLLTLPTQLKPSVKMGHPVVVAEVRCFLAWSLMR